MNPTPLIAGGVTALLCAGFLMTLGRETRSRTTYADLRGLAVRFLTADSKADADSSRATDEVPGARTGTFPGTADAEDLRDRGGKASASKAAAVSSRLKTHRTWRQRSPGRDKSGKSPEAAEPLISTSTVPQPDRTAAGPSPLEGIPQPVLDPPPAAPTGSPEALRDAFEADASKFPLDAEASADGVALRLVGLSRVGGRFVVKAAVTNRGGDDFFVKELGAYIGLEAVSVQSHIRLFVEPGRTREGYVVFTPRPGAQVKIKLKEDREKGRVLEVPVQYPF